MVERGTPTLTTVEAGARRHTPVSRGRQPKACEPLFRGKRQAPVGVSSAPQNVHQRRLARTRGPSNTTISALCSEQIPRRASGVNGPAGPTTIDLGHTLGAIKNGFSTRYGPRDGKS